MAQITNTLVFADPEDTDARYLCADALEQLGYQAESGPWRSAYLCAAQELRMVQIPMMQREVAVTVMFSYI